MEKKVRLKDRTELLIRDMMPEDLDLSLAFFRALPEEDRDYLRRDVVQREVVKKRIREIRAGDVMRPQKAARSIFRRLGFHQEIVLPDYVVDLKGEKQDMIIMRCDLEAVWREMEDFLATGDWERTS